MDRQAGVTDIDGKEGEDGLEGVDVEEEEASLTEAASSRVLDENESVFEDLVQQLEGHKKAEPTDAGHPIFYRLLFETPHSRQLLFLGKSERRRRQDKSQQQE